MVNIFIFEGWIVRSLTTLPTSELSFFFSLLTSIHLFLRKWSLLNVFSLLPNYFFFAWTLLLSKHIIYRKVSGTNITTSHHNIKVQINLSCGTMLSMSYHNTQQNDSTWIMSTPSQKNITIPKKYMFTYFSK